MGNPKRKDQKRDSCSSSSSSSSSKSSSSKDSKCNDLYNYCKKKLLCDDDFMIAGSDAYGSLYSTSIQNLNVAQAVTFEYNQTLLNIDHIPGTPDIYVRKGGVYTFVFVAETNEAAQFGLFINGLPIFSAISGSNTGAGQFIMRQIETLQKNDRITIRNFDSAIGTITLNPESGGIVAGTNCELVIQKIASLPNDNYGDSDSEDEKISKREKHLFEKMEKKLLCDPSLMIRGSDVFGALYATTTQNVAINASVLYTANTRLYNTTHATGSGDLVVSKDGVYQIYFLISTAQSAQFTVFVNGIPDLTTTAGTNKGAGQLTLRQAIPLKKNDIVSVRNYTSSIGTVVISGNAGGLLQGVSAQLIVFRISPLNK
jgi:hypothetical protein